MNYQNMPLSELEKQKAALLKLQDSPRIRAELEDVANWIKLRTEEQKLKASPPAIKSRFRLG